MMLTKKTFANFFKFESSMKPLELEIFFHSEETATLRKLEVDYDLSDCETRKMTFYKINAVSPYLDGDNEFCSIHSNGSEFIANASYNVVRNLIIWCKAK